MTSLFDSRATVPPLGDPEMGDLVANPGKLRVHNSATLSFAQGEWIMRGPSGEHRMNATHSDRERINAHWQTFASSERNSEPHAERFNCLSSGDTLAQFSGFYIAPVRVDSEFASTQCAAGMAEYWTIYGLLPSGEALAVHDEFNEPDIVRIAAQIIRETGLPFQISEEDHGHSGPRYNLMEVCCDVTNWIIEDIPERDAEDFRDDDFDNHALAALREALSDYSNYQGLNTARDPYEVAA